MDRRTAGLTALSAVGLTLTALLASRAWTGDEFDLPEPPRSETAQEPPTRPRVPPGFDLALPVDATVRYGESTGSRATVLYTTEAPAERALTFARDQLEVRGWTVRERDGSSRPPGPFREALDAFDEGERPTGSAVIERGAAEITRVHLSLRLVDGEPFHAPDEPRAWRVVSDAPLPARPGATDPDCMRWLRRLCVEQERVGGPPGVDCVMDHRAACGYAAEPGYVARSLRDAERRLMAASRAHAIVGSRRARAQTLAQLRVELLGARACLARAARVGGESATLAALVAAMGAEGVVVDADTAGWFTRPPGDTEIPSRPAP